MTLVVRNSLTRKLEELKPIVDGKITMYTCGPTVYGIPHIGNYRTFFMSDMIRRYLEFKGYDVIHVMNITDIDDKTIRDSAEEGMPIKEFTEKYTDVFFEGIDWLNIKRAHVYPRATENIQEMIDWIEKLVDKKYAYDAEDGVYFSIRKFKNYGKPISIKKQACDVNKIIKEEIWFAQSPEKISIVTSLSDELPKVHLDAARFGETVKELIYMKNGNYIWYIPILF